MSLNDIVALVVFSFIGLLIVNLITNTNATKTDFQVLQKNSNKKVCQVFDKSKHCYKVERLKPEAVK